MKSLFQRTAHHVLNHFLVALPLATASPALAQEKLASPLQTEIANTIVPLNPKAFVKNMPIAQIDLVDFYKTLAQDMPDLVQYMDQTLLPKELKVDDDGGDDPSDDNLFDEKTRIMDATLGLGEESFENFRQSLAGYFFKNAGNMPADQSQLFLQGIHNMSDGEIIEFIVLGKSHALPLYSASGTANADRCLLVLVKHPDLMIGRIQKDIGGKPPAGYDEDDFIARHEETHCHDPRLITASMRNKTEADMEDPSMQLVALQTETDADLNASTHASRALVQTIADMRTMDAAVNAYKTDAIQPVPLNGEQHNSSFILNSLLDKHYAASHASLADLQQTTVAYDKFREAILQIQGEDDYQSLVQKIYDRSSSDGLDVDEHIYSVIYIIARLSDFQDPNTRLVAQGYVQAFDRIDHTLGAGFSDKVTVAIDALHARAAAPATPKTTMPLQAGAGARP